MNVLQPPPPAQHDVQGNPLNINQQTPAANLRTVDELENYKLHRRFDRLARLIGDPPMKRLMESHVMILGIGGVGSWAAESIARSGVGEITIVDFDEICITNFNRQIHSLNGLVGKEKTAVMADRLQAINPGAKINAKAMFYNADHCAQIFEKRPDYVIDSIDNITAKCHLLNYCRTEKIPVITSTGSGGRLDPTRVQVADLSETSVDPLAREVRKLLRHRHGFPMEGKGPFGIAAVYSTEPATVPNELKYDKGKGFQCVCPQGDNPYFQCDNRNLIMGNASFVTGAFGLVCASAAVRHLISGTN